MRTLILAVGLSVGVAMAAVQHGNDAAPPSRPIDQTRAAAEFTSRVNAYVSLHRSLEGTVPTIAVSADYAEVVAAVDALGAKIRAARSAARRGDVFTFDVECWFREMVATSLRGRDITALRAALNEENPPNVEFVLRINGPWPEGASLGPMPPQLLADLPRLPDDLQYRFLDRDLALWDSHANVVVDFIGKVLP